MASKRGGKGQPSGKTYGPKQTNPPIPQTPPVVVIQQPPQRPPQVVQPPEERRRRRDEFERIPDGKEAEFFGQELINWERNISSVQQKAVFDYTGNWYDPINEHLRKVKNFSSDYKKELKEKIKPIDSALEKFNLKKNITVYRGSTNDLILGAKNLAEVKKLIGTEVQDKGFMSTAVNKGSRFSGDVFYEIKVPKGKGRGAYIGQISHFGHEKEFLLARGTKFRITGARENKSGQLTVQLEVIGKSKK